MAGRFCATLDARRAENRGEPVRRDGQDPFSACPRLGEQVLAPVDTDHDGRFDTLRVLMPPYVAGPYTEGDYIVDVPFAAADLAGVSAAYRPAFEAMRER
jgi:hypothetical protein